MDQNINDGWEPVPQGNAPSATPQGGNNDGWEPVPQGNAPQSGIEGIANTIGNAPTDLYSGIAKGVLSTTTGLGDIIHRAGEAIHPGLGEAIIPESGLRAEEAYTHPHGAVQNIGYGGETLTEFLAGDEALKGLSLADKALTTGKILKTVEKSPRMMEALKIGAKELAKQSARAGAVQGAQTFVRTGGDVSEAAKAGLETAGTTAALGGVVGTVAGAIGKVASKAGEAAKSAGELADTAANAPDKQTIVQNIQGQLQNTKKILHSDYEAGINDITNRLGDNNVEVKNSPVSKLAQELLEKPDPDDHDLTKATAELAGQKIDPKVRELLENYANGTKPLTEEDIQAAKEASKPSGLVDASGAPLKTEKVEPKAKPADPLTATDLVKQRQNIRATAANYEPGDINARVLNKLLGGFDDTMDQIAAKSGDANAVSDYQALRDNYRSKIGTYNNPVIKNLMEGKPDDAAKAFIATKSASGLPTAGKTEFNIGQLKTALGEEGFNQFRNAVFDSLLKGASDVTKNAAGDVTNTNFNPAKFVDSWGRISDGTKKEMFGYGNPSALPQNYVNSLVTDAKTAANFQKLVRYGLIAGPGAAATTVAPAVGGVSTVLAFILGREGAGGIAKGREVLDYVANHPRTWAAFRKLGAAADNGLASKVAKAGTTGGKVLGNQINAQDQPNDISNPALQRAMQGPAQALGGSSPNPKQAAKTSASEQPLYVTPSATKEDLVKPGNIDLKTRKDIKNPDGSHSSVFSMSFGTDDGEVLVPGVGDGKTYPLRKLTPKEALDQYKKTGKNLGTFKTPDAADAYGQKLHEDQAKMKVVNGVLQ